jgi:hypothetical protein
MFIFDVLTGAKSTLAAETRGANVTQLTTQLTSPNTLS